MSIEEEKKRKAIRKYFQPYPKWVTVLIVMGALFLFFAALALAALLLGFENYNEEYLIDLITLIFAGGGLIAIGAYVIYADDKKRPSDQEIDEYIAQDLEMVKRKAMEKNSLDEADLVSEPLIVTGPVILHSTSQESVWNTGGAEVLFKKGKDNKIRYTPIGVTVLLPTQHQLVIYQGYLDLLTGNVLNESTDEYFYRDIVSISTKTTSITLKSEKFGYIQLDMAEIFTLTTSGGTSVSVILNSPKFKDVMGIIGGEISTTEAEEVVRTVRRFLREKKMV